MYNFDEKTIIKKIEELRKSYGWSRYELAKRSDIPLSTLNNTLKGQHIPSVLTLYKICSGLNLLLSDFFSLIEAEITSKTDEFKDLYLQLDSNSRALALIYMKGLAHKPIYDNEKIHESYQNS